MRSIIGPKPYWRFWIGALTLMWLPLPLLGFNSHHDGYIFTATRLTRDSIIHGGKWPFNQFGSFWVFPHALLGLIVPDQFLFIATRYLTLAAYVFTGFLTWKLAKKMKGASFANLSLFLFFASQPFIGTHASGFNSWPSAIAMPILLILGILIFRLEDSDLSNRKEQMELSLMGVLVATLMLTRAQVGILALITTTFFILVIKRFKGLLFFVFGIFGFGVLYFTFLWRNRWLSDSLKDEFIFGSIYARAGGSIFHLPVPFFTSFGTFVILFFLVFYRKILPIVQSIFRTSIGKLLAIILIFTSFLAIYLILKSRNLGLISVISVTTRRFWMSLLFASILLFTYRQIRLSIGALRNGTFHELDLQRNNFLALLSISAQSQVWPLFDQMHSWWGSVPGVIVVALTLVSLQTKQSSELSSKRMAPFGLLVILSILIVQWVPQVMAITDGQIPRTIGRIPLLSQANSANDDLQKFFDQNFTKGERVLNLCQNADVFYKQHFVISSSRLFVYWPQMTLVPNFIDEMKTSPADAILTCSLNELNPENQKSDEIQQSKIVSNLTNNSTAVIEANVGGKTWKISRNP